MRGSAVPFRRAIFNNMHIKSAALIVGIFLWMFAKGEQEASRLLSVPLVLRNMPDGLTTVQNLPATADVVFRGDNKELVRLSMWGEPYAVVDMSGAQADRTIRVTLSSANVVLPRDTEVQVEEVREPRNLDLEVDELINRRVEVLPVVDGVPAEGSFVYGRKRSLPDSIFVFGPARVVTELRLVTTAPLSIAGRRNDVDAARRIVFEEGWNLHAVPKEVRIHVDIEGTDVTTLAAVPVIFEHEPGFEEATVEPSAIQLTLSGPEHLVTALSEWDVQVGVDAMGLPRGTHELVPVVDAPDGVRVDGVTPPRVTVTLR